MPTRGTGPLEVAVVGGGLCGLSVAVALQRAGLDVNLYEAAAQFGEIGAGVGIGPNAIRALRNMDLLDAILERIKPEVPEARSFLFQSGTDHEIYYDYPQKEEDSSLGIHRAVFLDALVPLLESSRAHFNKRCIGAQELPNGKIQLTFIDGSQVEADVVLGADGIRSVIRKSVVGANGSGTEGAERENGEIARVHGVAFTNTIAYRGLIPTHIALQNGVDADFARSPRCLMGKDKHIIIIPIKDGKIINVAAFVTDRSKALPSSSSNNTSTSEQNIGGAFLSPSLPAHEWVSTRDTKELLDHFSDFSPSARTLLSLVPTPSAWAIHACAPPLSTYARGRIALLGDAAHAMPPHLGAGAGQAIEDARTIGRLLAHPQVRPENIEAVLAAYSALRAPRANDVLAGSHRTGEIYEQRGPHVNEGGKGVVKDLEGHWKTVWEYDLEAAIDRTIEELEKSGVL